MTEQHPVCTCEDVLAQSRWATIFAVVEVLLWGGGALEVLHGQTVTQDVLLQVRTGPELFITNIRIDRREKWWVISRETHLVCNITQPKNTTQLQFCLFVGWTLCGVCFVFSFCNNVIVLLIWNSNSANENTFSVRGNHGEDHTLLFESRIGLGHCG